jgi:putative ABC transport system ATP-binding protein
MAAETAVPDSATLDEACLVEVFTALADTLHKPLDPERLRATCRRPATVESSRTGEARTSSAPTPSAWVDDLASRGDELGLRIVPIELSASEIVGLAAHELPVVVPVAGGVPALIDTTRAGLARLRTFGSHPSLPTPDGERPSSLTRPRGEWLRPRDLAARIGARDERERMRVVAAEVSMPLTGGPRAAGSEGAQAAAEAHAHDPHGHGHGSGHARVASFISLERDDLAAVLLYSVFIGLTSLAVPVAVQALVNTVAFGTMVQPLVVLSLVVLGCLALSGLLRAVQARVVERLQERLFVRAATEFAYRLPRIRVDALDSVHAPEKVNRFFDALTAQKALAGLLLDGSLLALQAVLGMVLLAFYHPFLLAFDVVLLGTIVGIIFGLGRKAVPTSLDESAAKYDLVAWLEDIARSPLAFRLHPAAALERTDDLALRYLHARRAHFAVVFRQIVGGVTLQAVASAALLTVGGLLVLEGQLAIGQLVAAEIVVTTVVAGVAKLGKHLESYYDLATSLEKLGTVTDLPLERDDAMRSCIEGGPARLTVSAVGFGHAKGALLFEGLGFEVRPGEKLAIFGGLGSGKSALADLVFGLRAPSSGSILLDGIDSRELSLGELRRHVALVRDVEIVEGSVFENVALWRPHVTPADVHAALDAVGLGEAIARLPEGVKTRLNPGGSPLSLGQAARLVLARAIAGRPRLLVLDGALDGHDDASLVDLEARIQAVCQGRTTLLVLTSFDSVASWCDRTLELRAGALVARAKEVAR